MSNVSLSKQRKSYKHNERTLMANSLHFLSSNLLIRLFSVKRVARYCRISQIPVLVFSSKVSSSNRQKPLECGRTTNVFSALPQTICRSSALKRLLTVVRGHFGRKTYKVSITYSLLYRYMDMCFKSRTLSTLVTDKDLLCKCT